jgi:hypothetical protein
MLQYISKIVLEISRIEVPELSSLYYLRFSLRDTYFPAYINQAMITYSQFNYPRINCFIVFNFSEYEINTKSLGMVAWLFYLVYRYVVEVDKCLLSLSSF